MSLLERFTFFHSVVGPPRFSGAQENGGAPLGGSLAGRVWRGPLAGSGGRRGGLVLRRLAALLRSNAVTLAFARSHHGAASRMLLVMRRERKLLMPLGGTKVWEDVLWAVSALEKAHPQIAPDEGPQLEYPWEDVRSNIQWPARD